MIACYMRRPTVIKALLAKGADPNITNVDGWTPVHELALEGKTKLCQTLVENKACPADLSKRATSG